MVEEIVNRAYACKLCKTNYDEIAQAEVCENQGEIIPVLENLPRVFSDIHENRKTPYIYVVISFLGLSSDNIPNYRALLKIDGNKINPSTRVRDFRVYGHPCDEKGRNYIHDKFFGITPRELTPSRIEKMCQKDEELAKFLDRATKLKMAIEASNG